MKIPNIEQYRQEKKTWKNMGEPKRSDEKVIELYAICSKCEHYLPLLENVGQCGICTCILRKDGERINKLRWATTRCPLDEPKWTEEPGYEKSGDTLNSIPPPPAPNKGCGCG